MIIPDEHARTNLDKKKEEEEEEREDESSERSLRRLLIKIYHFVDTQQCRRKEREREKTL